MRRGEGQIQVTKRGLCWLATTGALELAMTWVLTDAGLVSQHAQIYSIFGLWALVLMLARPTWAWSALAAGFVMAGTMGLFYGAFFLPLFPDIIARWWILDRCWGIFIGPLPLEEFAWAAASATFPGAALYCCLAMPLPAARSEPAAGLFSRILTPAEADIDPNSTQ
jgi:hypothetical protein